MVELSPQILCAWMLVLASTTMRVLHRYPGLVLPLGNPNLILEFFTIFCREIQGGLANSVSSRIRQAP